MPPKKILVFHVSNTVVTLLREITGENGVIAALDNSDALHQIEEDACIGVVIIELNMDKANGFQLLRLIKESRKRASIRIIVVSDSKKIEDEMNSFELGAHEYIRTPTQLPLLKYKVKNQLEIVQKQGLSEQELYANNKELPSSFISPLRDIFYLKNGSLQHFPVPQSDGKTDAGAYVRTVSEEYLQRKITNKIAETNRIIAQCLLKTFSSTQEQLDYALQEAIKLAESQYGYLYYYDETTKEFTLNSWVDGTLDDCSVKDKQKKRQLGETGMWGEVVRQRKPIIINDFDALNSLKKGYPEGHVVIHKFMSIPIFENSRIVAVVGYANKRSDYSDNDIYTATVLMNGVWMATRKIEKEKETELLLKRTQSIIDNHEAVMLLLEPISGKIIEANKAAANFYGYSKEELLNMTIQEINLIELPEAIKIRAKALCDEQKYFTFPHRLRNGNIKIVDVYTSPIEYCDNKVLFSIVIDVTTREEVRKLNEYLAYHDYLTDLFNRRYFEEEFYRRNTDGKEYPIAIIMGDVNGLKQFNDTYGHLEGDHALINISEKIKKCAGDKDILARIGGDEFAILIFGTNEVTVRKCLDKLDQQVNDVENEKGLNALTISLGYGIQRNKDDTLDVLLKEAETFMYNRKYYNTKSTRSNTVNVIMETLFTKSEREKAHSERVGIIAESIALKMNLDKPFVAQIRVAGFLHDIGKIGIDESILNKKGKLNKNERETMKLHSIKGADILENTIEFKEIADFVLSHHERINGSGYPNGLMGEDIPLASRIIAVADSYDAMTHDRVYRKKMSHTEAINELERCSGILFDPEIVAIFINKVIPEILSETHDRYKCLKDPSFP